MLRSNLADRLLDPVCQRPSLRRQFEPAREAFEQAETERFLQPTTATVRQMQFTRARGVVRGMLGMWTTVSGIWREWRAA
jgi:hypothetical protein